MPKTRRRRATEAGADDGLPAVAEQNRATVLRFSETNRDHWIERLATEPSSAWVATWHDPGGRRRQSRIRAMRCQATGKNGLQCKRSVSIGAPLCAVHTRRVFGLEVRASGVVGGGNGLFTTVDRERGALLCPYPGRWYRTERLHADWAADYGYATSDGRWCIDALGLRGIGSLANTALGAPAADGNRTSDYDACNAIIADVWDDHLPEYRVVVQAVRPLRKGDEILVYYGPAVTFPTAPPPPAGNRDPARGPVVRTLRIRRPKVRRALLTF